MRKYFAILCGVIFGSCAHAMGPQSLPSVSTNVGLSGSGGFRTLHAFKGELDGQNPSGTLVDLDGTLYGTTPNGGAKGHGSVFKISASGDEQVIYSFQWGSDGGGPEGGLTVVDGVLYGTTWYGGGVGNCSGGCGIVYAVTTSGSESVVYRFTGGTDGSNAAEGLIAVNGTLYGTTTYGGCKSESSDCHDSKCAFYGCGTVFAVSTSGSEQVLYRFQDGNDGEYPEAGLLSLNGTLYGTTFYSVFEISASNAFSVLYHFGGSGDGLVSKADLIAVNGVLYGTTQEGGANGQGTVFDVSTSGAENVLYSFKGGKDGTWPQGGLVLLNGILYGTTKKGGASCKGAGCGTMFTVNPSSGKESVVYRFAGRFGERPCGGDLLDVSGALYGTTYKGGAGRDGTVFEFTPASASRSLKNYPSRNLAP